MMRSDDGVKKPGVELDSFFSLLYVRYIVFCERIEPAELGTAFLAYNVRTEWQQQHGWISQRCPVTSDASGKLLGPMFLFLWENAEKVIR